MPLQAIRILLFLLIAASSVSNVCAHDIKLTIDGKEKEIWSVPHKPYLTVTSLAQLREHYQEVKDVLPPMPFLMEGQWIVPGSKDSFRTFPDDPELGEYFSPNGDYVAVIEWWKGFPEGTPYSKYIKFMTTEGRVLWEKRHGPIAALVTDEGCIIGRSQYNEPLALTYYDREGKVFKFVQGIFTERNMPKTGHLKLVPQEKLILAWEVRQVVVLNYEGEVLWRYTPPWEPVMALVGNPGLDTLSRGIYVPITYRDRKTSLLFFHAHTGATQGSLWDNGSISFPYLYFSRDWKVAGLSTDRDIDIFDWQTGKLLSQGKKPQGVGELLESNRKVGSSALPGGLEQTSLLVVPWSGRSGVCIFNVRGELIWSCDIRADNTQNFLSVSGKKLGVAMTGGSSDQVLKFSGVLLYGVDAS